MRTRVKYCGFTHVEDVRLAAALGVDAVGFVFYPKSPRYLEPARAADLRRVLPSWVRAVGLFVNAGRDQVMAVHREVGLDIVQFHGDETPEDCLRATQPDTGRPLPWWRAVRMAGPGDLLESAIRYRAAEALLLDSVSTGYGGSGCRFDWSWIPAHRPLPIVLSGGLSPDGVAEAIARVRPMAVDVSSGIQAEDPRRKSAELMERFMVEVLRADAHRTQRELS